MAVFDCHHKAGFWLTALGRGFCGLTSSFQMKRVVPKCICFSLFFFFSPCSLFLYLFTILLRPPKITKKKEKRAVQITTIHLEGKKNKKEGTTEIFTLSKGGKMTPSHKK